MTSARPPSSTADLEWQKLNAETAQIAWKELQRFYAAGSVVVVDAALDLVDVAYQIAQDNAPQFKQWIAEGKIAAVADHQALAWYESDAVVWAVTVKPWVLIQDRT